MSTYSELLKDPRWQRKRLEILNRDNFTCYCCGSSTKTLHVHHKKYLFGVPPWDYDNKWLTTLCDGCHETEEKYKKQNAEFSKISEASGVLVTDLIDYAVVICYMKERYNHEFTAFNEMAKRRINEESDRIISFLKGE